MIGFSGQGVAVVAVSGGGIESCGTHELQVWDRAILDAISEAQEVIDRGP